jgi:hypothetical protein
MPWWSESADYKEALNVLGTKDICQRVNGTRTMKRIVIIKKRAMWPVSSYV